MHTSRRYFIKRSGAIALGFTGLQTFLRCGSSGELLSKGRTFGLGSLQTDPEQILDLPDGFSHKIISRYSDRMDDGFFVPHRPDGMATFPAS
jgi:hypothetical protein